MVTLTDGEAAYLVVLLDEAVPRHPGGPLDWEGAGRRAAEALLGVRSRCRCIHVPDVGTVLVPGCQVHDETAVWTRGNPVDGELPPAIERAADVAKLAVHLRNEHNLVIGAAMLAAHLILAHGWDEDDAVTSPDGELSSGVPLRSQMERHEALAHDGDHHH